MQQIIFVFQNDTIHLIWAMNDQDPKSADSFQKHETENRGSKSMLLLNPDTKDNIQLPADAEPWNFTGHNV